MDIDELLIKEFNHWNLNLNENQYPFIGSCDIIPKRKVTRVIDLNEAEEKELYFHIRHEITVATGNLFDSSESIITFPDIGEFFYKFLPFSYDDRNFYGMTFVKMPDPKKKQFWSEEGMGGLSNLGILIDLYHSIPPFTQPKSDIVFDIRDKIKDYLRRFPDST